MPGSLSLSRRRQFWTPEEDQRLLIGYNRYFESFDVYRRIEKDLELHFFRIRSNKDIRDRIRSLKSELEILKSFFVLNNREEHPHSFIPEEFRHLLYEEGEEEQQVDLLPLGERKELKRILFTYTANIATFMQIYDNLPIILNENPLLTCLTWIQIYPYFSWSSNRLGLEKFPF